MKFSGGVGHGRRKNRLDFGGDPNSFVDPGSFFTILHHYETGGYRDRCRHLAYMRELN